MRCKDRGQCSLLSTGLFPPQHKAVVVLQQAAAMTQQNKMLKSHHRATLLISPKIDGCLLLFRLKGEAIHVNRLLN